MEQVIEAYCSISGSNEFRVLERMRKRARLDEASARAFERGEGAASGAG